jgi:hypothetical protein
MSHGAVASFRISCLIGVGTRGKAFCHCQRICFLPCRRRMRVRLNQHLYHWRLRRMQQLFLRQPGYPWVLSRWKSALTLCWADIVLGVPGDVSVARVVALVHAIRGAA